MSDHKAATATGDHYTSREQQILGRFNHLGLLRYRDLSAGYCVTCQRVYGVECPRCKAESGPHYRADETIFTVEHPIETTRFNALNWVPVTCRKCDYRFRVIVQSGAYE